ncbi:MAG: hypothetical protein IKF68_04890 [Erysipelotrichaceae bacterium]|nr:hypothetical protein [Erysipelotrichaceae bacterium]
MFPYFVGAGIVLCICSVATCIFSIRRDANRRRIFVIYALITALAAVAVRCFQQSYPDALGTGVFLKFSASLPSVLFAFKGYRNCKTLFALFILLAIILGMIADIVINISFAAGGLFFLVGHLLYDVAFIKEKRPSKRQLILWLILTALMVIPLYIFRERIGSLFYGIGALVYIAILISTVVFSYSLDRMIFAAAMIFAFSDCFMIVNILTDGALIMRILALLVYYISLLLYGTALWKRSG